MHAHTFLRLLASCSLVSGYAYPPVKFDQMLQSVGVEEAAARPKPTPAVGLMNKRETSTSSCPVFTMPSPDPNLPDFDAMTAPPGSLITPAPTAGGGTSVSSCSLNRADPDEGINTPFCLCSAASGSVTLPVLSVDKNAGSPDKSCAYSNMPATNTFTPSEATHSVWTSNCYVCSQAVVNEDACLPMPGCTPTEPPMPTMTVQVSNQNAKAVVWRGSDNGTEMYDTIVDLLTKNCPEPASDGQPTECKLDAMNHTVEFVDPQEEPGKGNIVFEVQNSNYTTRLDRDFAIASVAGSFALSASGPHCNTTKIKTSDCPNETEAQRATSLTGCEEDQIVCIMADGIEANYFTSQFTNIPRASLKVEAEFQEIEHDDGLIEFICGFLTAAIEGAEMLGPKVLLPVEEIGDIDFEAECLCLGTGKCENLFKPS